MQKKCIICAKTVNNWVVEPLYPEKYVCLNCLNSLAININTIEKELSPLVKDFSNGITSLKQKLDKKKL